ncbi:MAG: hypothetical protein GY772_13280 [bacterium]|nr:hypothetical protein [bacterium]
MTDLLRKAGAKATSKDVHWPLTLVLRSRDAPSGFRYRTPGAHARRQAQKALRVYGPGGRPSGSQRPGPWQSSSEASGGRGAWQRWRDASWSAAAPAWWEAASGSDAAAAAWRWTSPAWWTEHPGR